MQCKRWVGGKEPRWQGKQSQKRQCVEGEQRICENVQAVITIYTLRKRRKKIIILSQTLLMDKKYSPKITVGGTKNSCNMSNL